VHAQHPLIYDYLIASKENSTFKAKSQKIALFNHQTPQWRGLNEI